MSARCSRCRILGAVATIPYARLSLCPNCFVEFYRARVRRTVEEFKMFREDDVVGVAVSGGKDSAALLHALRQAYPRLRLKALHVDLGIPMYSAHCQEKAEALASMLNVEFHVFSLPKELDIRVEDFKKTAYKGKLCSVCGTIRRRILEELAVRANVDVLATGHNLEDIVGVMFENFLYGRWEQFVRIKPVLPPLDKGMASKVKPLLKSPEKENLLYCTYTKIPFREIECPYSAGTAVQRRAEALETLSKENRAIKHQLLNRFLEIMPAVENLARKPNLSRCKTCSFPSSGDTCAFCKRIAMVKEALSKT
ncbi:MAG: hypothetical protein NZ952_03995 [Candidatus Bathyarchaeota archaeon]|nr:hypothetical protein [Candidatus Bathyarchaeota archaeon]